MTVPVEALAGRLSGLPAGLVVERDRIEVRYAGAKEAVVKLVALALNNDYERFERSWRGRGHRDERGPGSGGHPAAGRARQVGGRGAAVGIVDAGPVAVERFLEFFAAQVANARTRAAYARAAGRFLSWCAARGLGLRAIAPLHVAAYIRTHPGSTPTVKQHLAAIRVLCDWLVVH